MRAFFSTAALAALVFSPLAAQAADLAVRPYGPPPYYAPPVPVRSPWSGLYVGVFVGATIGHQKLDESGANQFFATTDPLGGTLITGDPATSFGFSGYNTSLTGGGFLGYNYQFGRMIVGAEADFAAKKNESSASRSVVSNAVYSNADTANRSEFFAGSVRQNWDASARLRLGGLIAPSVLIYGTGGVAFGSVDSAFSYSAMTLYSPSAIAHTAFGSGSWNDTRIGWTAGAGIETAIAPNWKVRAEYRFTDLGRYTKDVPLIRTTSSNTLPNTGSAAAAADVSASFHTLRLGVAYNF